MNNLFTKALLCGVLASSFLLINCQKAPNRPASLKVNPPAKPSALKVGVCTEPIASNYKLLKESDKKIQDKLVSVKPDAAGDIPATDVEELKALAIKLNDLSKTVLEAIVELKVEACKIHEGNDAKKPAIDKADTNSIRQVRYNAGKAIKEKTKVPNVITDEDAAAAAGSILIGQELIIEKKLAETLSNNDNSNGAAVITQSDILNGAAAINALADVKVTACSLDITNKEEVKIGGKLTLVSTEAGTTVKPARNTLKMVFTVTIRGDGNSTVAINCNIAEKVKFDSKFNLEAPKEIRTALGSLVSDAVKVQPEPPPKQLVGVCTPEIATDYDLLKKSDKKIQEKLISVKPDNAGNIPATDVEELNGLAKELNGLSKKVLAAFALLKDDSCIIHEGNDAKKPVIGPAKSSSIKQVRSNAGKAIKAKTKVDNEITAEDAASTAAPKTDAAEALASLSK